jgi:peptidoglycan/LPS O-acetylase OafA/YrhL
MNAAIDLLKGLAIMSVLWQHTVTPAFTDDVWGNVWIRTAVPIFIVLMGLNLMRSAVRRGGVDLSRPALRDFYGRRVRRIAVPLLLVLAAAYVIAAGRGELHPESGWLLLGFPVNAPGNYFLPALIGLVLLFPLIGWAFARRPLVALVACLVISVGFEVFALSVLGKEHDLVRGLWYQGNPLRWLGAFGLGVWLAGGARLADRRTLVVALLAIPSLGYLVAEQLSQSAFDYFPPNFNRVTNVLAAPWAALIVAVALHALPATVRSLPGRALAHLGAASYHVFLVQMLVIGVVVGGAAGVVLSIVLGVAYFHLLPPAWGGLGTLAGRGRPSFLRPRAQHS